MDTERFAESLSSRANYFNMFGRFVDEIKDIL